MPLEMGREEWDAGLIPLHRADFYGETLAAEKFLSKGAEMALKKSNSAPLLLCRAKGVKRLL